MPQYKCPSCHKLFEWPNSHCPHCGMKITISKDKAKPLYCSECGAELYEGKDFCPSCGSDQSVKEVIEAPVVVSNSQPSNRGGTTAMILGSIGANVSYFSFALFPIFGFMAITSLILGIVSTIMGAINARKSSTAKAGMIIGIVTIGVSILTLLLYAALIVVIVLLIVKTQQ